MGAFQFVCFVSFFLMYLQCKLITRWQTKLSRKVFVLGDVFGILRLK